MSSLSAKQGPRYRHRDGESEPYETIAVEKLTPIIAVETQRLMSVNPSNTKVSGKSTVPNASIAAR